ncbi:MAG: pitrilysin family protein [Woeseiaceae bacterium]|nr:pitrilysin family protein [Woeseiaceae bacterium]
MALFAELRRRNVFKVALLYLVAAWLLLWLESVFAAQFGLPGWTREFLYLIIVIGFPVALIFAYVYEITPTGLKKAIEVDQTQSIVYKTGQKLNAAVFVLAMLGIVALVLERMLPDITLPPEERLTGTGSELEGVPPEIRAIILDNGLRIIVWPDHDIPNVAMYNFVRAGGRNEYPGITGVAHFFEHMMFNGTSKREPGEFDREMEAAGGANNAYTSNDVTVYQDWFPVSALETIFDLEADRFENLAIVPEVVESEREVVYSERRLRVDNDNAGKLFEQVYATAYVAHPYQFPVLGWPSDIENWTQQDLEDFYRTYYAPNNQTMVFAGAVDAEELFELAEDFFGGIPAQEKPQNVRTVEPRQQGTRRVAIETDAQTPLLHMAFHSGRASDPDMLAHNLLLSILAGDRSSRLHQLLVEQEQLAISVGVYLHEGFDPGLTYFYMTLPPGGDVAAVEARVLEELERVTAEGVTDAELAKARNIMLADFWREMATIDGKASLLGDFDVFHGSYEVLFSLPEQLEAVTVDDLKIVADKVFRRNNMTVGTLEPPPSGEAE